MSPKISPQAMRIFWLTVEYLRNDLVAWETIRHTSPGAECVQEYRTLLTRQIARLERLARRGIVTPTSVRLIERARNCLAGM